MAIKPPPIYNKSLLALRNGQDLTEELKDAPHAEEVFEKFKKVAILEG